MRCQPQRSLDRLGTFRQRVGEAVPSVTLRTRRRRRMRTQRVTRRMNTQFSDITAAAAEWVRRPLVSVVQDVQWGLRSLRSRPGFTLLAVAMLAAGIGINGAVFTI